MGTPYDDTVAVLVDISDLEEAFIYIKAADVNVTTEVTTGGEG